MAMRTIAPPSNQPLRVEPQQAPGAAIDEGARSTISKLRDMFQAEKASWTAAATCEAEALLDDFTLQRYLQARPDGIPAALTMLRESCEWRAGDKTSAKFCELHPHSATSSSARHRAAREHFYGGLGGMTRDGTPYFVERLGQADLSGFAREPAVLELIMDACVARLRSNQPSTVPGPTACASHLGSDVAHLECIFRTVRLCSAASGSLVKALIVVDAAGVSFSTLRHIGIVKAAAKVASANYPEGSSRVLIINAPRMFGGAWSLIAPLLPAQTRAKIRILTARHTATALAELVEPHELPAFLGGIKPDSECLVGRAQAVPAGLGRELEAAARQEPVDCN